jgi:molybdopterin synthase catalytic subunit
MQVTVRLFAGVREAAGSSTVEVEVPARPFVSDIRRALSILLPQAEELLRCSAMAVDGEYAQDITPVVAGSEVAVIPPVSGG